MSYRILTIIIVVLLFGCSEDFINLAPETDLNSADYYQNKSEIETAVNAAYASLASDGQYGYNFIHLMEIRADNSSLVDYARSGRRYGDIDFFTMTSENDVVEQSWNECYKGINRCNIVLGRIDAISDMTEKEKVVRKGEMLFIRALTYFNMVRLWGDVPIALTETVNPMDAFDTGRQPVDSVYKRIFSDLNDAIVVLPEKADNVGRATQGAAIALKGKVYLELKEYQNVINTLSPLINQFQLLSNYADVFSDDNKNNEEIIFSIQYASNQLGVGSKFANLFAIDISLVGTGSSYGDNYPSQSLINAFETNDSRFNTNIGYLYGIPYCNKYQEIVTTEFDGNNNFIVLRDADVLLMLSEAYNELGYTIDNNGNSVESFIFLNKIRSRARLNIYTSSDLPDQESFRKAVLKERRIELAFENHRWFDLVRTGNAKVVIDTKTTQGVIRNYESFRNIYPIPETEITTMNNPELMYQNPGY